MKNESITDQRSDLTKEFIIQMPSRLAERIEAYAETNDTTITGMVIEALDSFLREQQNRGV